MFSCASLSSHNLRRAWKEIGNNQYTKTFSLPTDAKTQNWHAMWDTLYFFAILNTTSVDREREPIAQLAQAQLKLNCSAALLTLLLTHFDSWSWSSRGPDPDADSCVFVGLESENQNKLNFCSNLDQARRDACKFLLFMRITFYFRCLIP